MRFDRRSMFITALVFASFLPTMVIRAVAEDGHAILERAAEFYEGLDSVQAEAEARFHLPPDPSADRFRAGLSVSRDAQIRLARPQSVAMTPLAGSPGLTCVQADEKSYVGIPSPPSYFVGQAGLLQRPFVEGIRTTSVSALLDFLLLRNVLGIYLNETRQGTLRGVKKVKLLGDEPVDEVDCHRLSVKGATKRYELWIALGERPWVMRYRETSKAGKKRAQVGIDLLLRNWQANPDLASAFEIEPPSGFERLETLDDLNSNLDKLNESSEEAGPRIGDPAPDLPLTSLEGKPFRLSSFRGKFVVVDFWATWCGPCVDSLPHFERASRSLGSEDIVFLALNRGESSQVVQKFVKKKRLEVQVALDLDESVSEAFGITAIPRFVVIDREGTIVAVHRGSTQTAAEMEELLAELLPSVGPDAR